MAGIGEERNNMERLISPHRVGVETEIEEKPCAGENGKSQPGRQLLLLLNLIISIHILLLSSPDRAPPSLSS